MKVPVVTFTGQSLRTLPDEDLLQLILRQDLPDFLMDVYTREVDYRMTQPTTEMCTRTEEVMG